MDITNLHQFFEWIGLSSLNVNNEYSPITSFIPTLVGGYMMALLTFPLFYYPFYYMIIGARKAKISASAKVAKFKNKHSKSDIIK